MTERRGEQVRQQAEDGGLLQGPPKDSVLKELDTDKELLSSCQGHQG